MSDSLRAQFFAEAHPNFFDRMKIAIVQIWLWFLNFILAVVGKVLFFRAIKKPKNILIYKLGNIGDVVCAMPAMKAIKERFPDSSITLLTSPGIRRALGAKDFLDGVSYLSKIKTYYGDDISSISKVFSLIRALRREKYDLFIQLPDDWARFRTLLRNEVFAKCIGVRSAFGFHLRTSTLFKKTQVDFTYKEREVEALLRILKRNGIPHKEVAFEFPAYHSLPAKTLAELETLEKNKRVILGVCMGGKTEDKKWPLERYSETLRILGKTHDMGVLFLGGPSEFDSIERVAKESGVSYVNLSGLSIKESIAAIRHADAFLTNDTGPMHIAAAVGVPIVALFSIRSVLGSWFPYGDHNTCLYKRFLKCNYGKEDCAKKSMLAITVDEVVNACEAILMRLKDYE